MARYNKQTVTPQVLSPVTTTPWSAIGNHEGGVGYARDLKSELFLAAVSYMGDDTYYESAASILKRMSNLVRGLATGSDEDVAWCVSFLRWLRRDGNMRTAPVVLAAEFVKARLDAGLHGQNRQVVRSVLLRADEPAEFIAYWVTNYGRNLPMPVKRGVGDALIGLGTERNVLKYDSGTKSVRFAHLLNLCHPGDRRGSAQHVRGDWQHDLFEYVVKSPYQADTRPRSSLEMLRGREALMALPVDQRRDVLRYPDRLATAGITWEALAGWLQGPMDAVAWEAIISSMGYMALLRNLRNFDEAGVNDQVAATVAQRLADPEQVAKSRQFPYRFLSAYKSIANDRWRVAIGRALDLSTRNVPKLDGRTLVVCDLSGSMQSQISAKSTMQRVEVGALFAVTLAYRCGVENVDLVGFANGHLRHELPRGGSVLHAVQSFTKRLGEVGHATMTADAVRATYDRHDRVVIVSDEQTQADDPTSPLPRETAVYTFNLGGYARGHHASGRDNRHTLGGLTDATFRMIPLLEAGQNADWDSIFRSTPATSNSTDGGNG